MERKLTVSPSPHLSFSETTPGIMLDVIIALSFPLIASALIFGIRSLLVTAVSVAVCVLSEYLFRKLLKRGNTIGDLSAVVTGMLLAFNLPVSIPLWMVALGAVFAIVVVKEFFGGLGSNFVNPALAARIVLMVSFPAQMSSWTQAAPLFDPNRADGITTATPLSVLKHLFKEGDPSASSLNASDVPTVKQMILGLRGGSLGEVCAIALFVGFVYLLWRGVISPAVPLTYIGTFAVLMFVFSGSPMYVAYQVLSGGLLLGAVFMATDYTTSPVNLKGKLIFGLGCGLLTVVIRLFGSMPEGVSFSIILMNILVPHIERITAPKPFGMKGGKARGEGRKEKKADGEKHAAGGRKQKTRRQKQKVRA